MVKTASKGGLMDFYVGIDVSKFKHTVAIIDQNGEVRKKSFDISNSREGFDSLLNELGYCYRSRDWYHIILGC